MYSVICLGMFRLTNIAITTIFTTVSPNTLSIFLILIPDVIDLYHLHETSFTILLNVKLK